LKKEIESLKTQFSEAVETPIHVITRTIHQISQDNSLHDEVRDALGVIVKSLASSNIYRPALSKVISESDTLDSMTKEWLVNELKYDRRVKEHVEWPVVSDTAEDTQRSHLRKWTFDVWQYDEKDLLPFVDEMFNDFDLIDHFNIPQDVFHNFLIEVKRGYLSKNPYHNFRHAFDVTQALYTYLTHGGAEYLTRIETLALLVGSICHDIEHPGLNNTYQINIRSKLALQYNDLSILENYHSFKTFSLMQQPGCNILQNFSDTDYNDFRKVVIKTILATDLSSHMEILSRFSSIVSNFDRENQEHRELFAKILIKCADISNPTRPLHIANYWSNLIQEEFFCQGDKEKEHCLKVSPFMDRENSSLPKMSVGFIDFFVEPLFKNLTVLLPAVSPALDSLKITKNQWLNLLAGEEKQLKKQNISK